MHIKRIIFVIGQSVRDLSLCSLIFNVGGKRFWENHEIIHSAMKQSNLGIYLVFSLFIGRGGMIVLSRCYEGYL